jgi:RHS repeat-associated protein
MHAALKRLLVALAWMARHMLTRPGWAAGLAAAEPGLLRRAFCPALGWSACVLLLAILPFGCGKDSTPSARQDEESPSPSPISDVPVGTVFYLGDHQHSPLVLTNARGEVIRTIAYQPYGSIRHQSGEGTDPFEFVANESDSGSGLGDFGARPYRHQAGIFLRPDPVAVLAPESLLDQPLRLAPYGYSGGDAINRADPHGEFWGAVLAGVASAIAITVTAQYANAPTKTNPQLKHKGLGELALQATATAISLFQGARAAVAIGSAGANIAQRALARVAETSGQRAAHQAAQQTAAGGLRRSANVSPQRLEEHLVRNGATPDRARCFADSFEGPITARIAQPGEQFVRYTGRAGSRGSFVTGSTFATPNEALQALNLAPYGNPAGVRQFVTANRKSLVFQGGIAGGSPGVRQTLVVNQDAFTFSLGTTSR